MHTHRVIQFRECKKKTVAFIVVCHIFDLKGGQKDALRVLRSAT